MKKNLIIKGIIEGGKEKTWYLKCENRKYESKKVKMN